MSLSTSQRVIALLIRHRIREDLGRACIRASGAVGHLSRHVSHRGACSRRAFGHGRGRSPGNGGGAGNWGGRSWYVFLYEISGGTGANQFVAGVETRMYRPVGSMAIADLFLLVSATMKSWASACVRESSGPILCTVLRGGNQGPSLRRRRNPGVAASLCKRLAKKRCGNSPPGNLRPERWQAFRTALAGTWGAQARGECGVCWAVASDTAGAASEALGRGRLMWSRGWPTRDRRSTAAEEVLATGVGYGEGGGAVASPSVDALSVMRR